MADRSDRTELNRLGPVDVVTSAVLRLMVSLMTVAGALAVVRGGR